MKSWKYLNKEYLCPLLIIFLSLSHSLSRALFFPILLFPLQHTQFKSENSSQLFHFFYFIYKSSGFVVHYYYVHCIESTSVSREWLIYLSTIEIENDVVSHAVIVTATLNKWKNECDQKTKMKDENLFKN